MSPEIYMNYKGGSAKLYSADLADSFSMGILIFALTFGAFPWKQASLYDSQYRLFATNPDQFWKLKLGNVSSRIKDKYMEMAELMGQLLDKESSRITINEFMQKIDDMTEENEVLSKNLLQKIYSDDELDELLEMIN